MDNFCYRTNFDFISDATKKKLLGLSEVISDKSITSKNDFSQFYKIEQGPGVFTFLKLPDDLELDILNGLPEKFKKHDPFIRLQITTGSGPIPQGSNIQCVPPHIDKGRKSGIFLLLSNDQSDTIFYDWKSHASKIRYRDMIADADEVIYRMKVCFHAGEYWLFNHSSIHSIDQVKTTRVSLNILYKDLEFQELLKNYLDFVQ